MKTIRYFFLSILVIMLLHACKSDQNSYLPNFDLLMPDSLTILNTNKIPAGEPIVLIFFSPDCEHCQAETTDILKNIDSLKKVHFYFATVDPFERLKVFNEYYNLSKYSNITVGRDYNFFMMKYFDIKSPPFTVIYNKFKESKIEFEGEIKASQIIEEINKL